MSTRLDDASTSPLLRRDDEPTLPPADHLLCLGKVQVRSFTATPPSVPPFGGTATLRWSVDVPTDCRDKVGIRLNGQFVNPTGTMEVNPASTTRYSLSASARGASKPLRSVSVGVDTSACVSAPVPETVIRAELAKVVDTVVSSDARLRLRRQPTVEVDPRGVHISLRLNVAIDNFADPDLDVDLTLGVRVRNGAADPFYRRFDVDLDWPWWVTAVSMGASKIVEEVLERSITQQLKPQVLVEIRTAIDDLVAQLPGDLRLHSLSLGNDAVTVTACPAEGDTPFIVVAHPDTERAGHTTQTPR